MSTKNSRRFPMVAPALAAVLVWVAGTGKAAAQTYGRADAPLEGQRYETMRALAHYLDERAEHAHAQATESPSRSRNTRLFVASVRDFARRAQGFHRRMDNYINEPWDVPRDVSSLEVRAQRVGYRMRRARLFEHIYDDWDAVLDVLDRMERLLAGESVQVPPAHAPRPSPTPTATPAPSPTPAPGLQGASLQEFRRLAHELDVQAKRTLEAARRDAASPPTDTERRFLEDLSHFSDEARSLHEKTDAGVLRPEEARPIVAHLLADARRADEGMRSANVFADVWAEWSEAVRRLNRMAELVR